jgi:hypothetical protein
VITQVHELTVGQGHRRTQSDDGCGDSPSLRLLSAPLDKSFDQSRHIRHARALVHPVAPLVRRLVQTHGEEVVPERVRTPPANEAAHAAIEGRAAGQEVLTVENGEILAAGRPDEPVRDAAAVPADEPRVGVRVHPGRAVPSAPHNVLQLDEPRRFGVRGEEDRVERAARGLGARLPTD